MHVDKNRYVAENIDYDFDYDDSWRNGGGDHDWWFFVCFLFIGYRQKHVTPMAK